MADDDNEKPSAFSRFFWNNDKQTFMGRTAESWGLISAFYICFFSCLIAWMFICISVFFETLTYTEPKWFGEKSLTQDNPGLALRPLPEYESTLIRFEQGKPSSYKPYTDHLEAFLLQYEPELNRGRNLRDCEVSSTFTKQDEETCRVDIDKVIGKSECTKEKDFGYEEGQPCVLLKMNRVFGFRPEPYETLDQLKADNGEILPRFLAFTPNLTIGIGCDGQNPADRENILDGGVVFYPNEDLNSYSGIPANSFPFLNQEGYRSPFVMVKFMKISRRVVIQVECKLYAKNIDNSGTARRHGIMRFEILRD